MVWYGMVWYGMVWYGMVWYGMLYGMLWYSPVVAISITDTTASITVCNRIETVDLR